MVSETVDKIKSRGYWDVTIHPTRRMDKPLEIAALTDTLMRSVVSMRGWPVPFIDGGQPFLRSRDSVGQDIDAQTVAHYEAWRFTTNAQFSQLRSISADWREGAERTLTPRGARAVIEVWEVLFYITELVELAARLALLSAAPGFHLGVELHGTAGRALVAGTPSRELHGDYIAGPGVIDDERTLPIEELTGNPRGVAVEMSAALLAGFGWHAQFDVLRDYQSELDRTR